jgi:ankyrin repeat protein
MIRLLVRAGVDVNALNNDSVTVMQMSTFANDAATLGLLVNEGKFETDKESRSKGQTLISMFEARNFDSALDFLEYRPNCNVTDRDGNGPLYIILDHGHWNQGVIAELIKGLLAGGADPNMKNRRGETPLFHDAVRSNYYIKSKLMHLVGFGVDPKAVDYNGNTLFHGVILLGNRDIETMEEICKLGLNLDQANNFGSTPVHLLCSIGEDEPIHSPLKKKLIRWVLHRNKRIDEKNHDGVTPLHLASTTTQYYVDQLLKLGAEPTMPTFEGLTALHLAARARQSNIVGMLIGAIPVEKSPVSFFDAKDQSGCTVLLPFTTLACPAARRQLRYFWKPAQTQVLLIIEI